MGDLADGEGLRSAAERYTFGDDASNAGDAPGGSATAWDADVAAGTMRPDGRPAPEDSDFGAGSGFTPDGRPDFDAELDYVDPTLEGYDDRLANFREACKASGIPAYAECGMLKGGDSDDPESFERHLPARFAVMQCVDLASAHGLTRSMFEEAMHDWPKHELAKAWATKAREVRLGGKQLTRRAPRTQERSEAPAPRGGHKNNRPRPADFYVQRTRANYDFPPYYPYKGKRGPPAPKPTADTYSRDAFRGWVAHKAATATGNGPVTFNDATAALMGNFQGTRKALVECLDHAVVRKIDAAADPFPRGREATLHVRFQRGLFLGGGIEIKDSKSLDQAEALFRRNKPLFRAAHRYFAGELSRAEEIKLEIAVKNMVAARHQGAAHSVEIKATDVAAAATSLSNASATLHVEHSVSMFPELVELARDAGLPEGRTRFLIRTMAGVAAVATAPTALAAGLALTQLVAGDPTLWALCEGAIGAATRVTDGASQ